MGSMFDCATVCKSNLPLRYVSLTLLFVFLVWQLNAFQNSRDGSVATTTASSYRGQVSADVFYGSEPQSAAGPVAQSPWMPGINGLNTEIRSRIAKVTSIFYSQSSYTTRIYEQALLTHREHNKLWGYHHFVQRQGELGPWSKHSYLLKLLVDELAKPPSERLDWLFWHDADILLMNNQMPLEAFLPPPTNDWAHVNFIAANDLQGLNDGAFFIRVCEWSVYFFAAGLSYPHFRPEVRLRNDEQGALNMLVREQKFKEKTLHVPQSWFNPYQDFGHDETFPPEWNWRLTWFEPGDLLIHFPGTGGVREQIMREWTDRRAANWDLYNRPLNETRAYANISHFWEQDAQHEEQRQLDFWRAYHLVYHDVGPVEDDVTRTGVKEIELRMKGVATQKEIDDAVEIYQKERIPVKREAYRVAWREMKEGVRPDKTGPM